MSGGSLAPGPVLVPARGPTRVLPAEGWPIVGVLWGFAVVWALGLANLVWPLVGALTALSLIVRRDVARPPGVGVYLLFLGLLVPSGLLVLTSTRGLVWAFRAATYAASGILFVHAYNLPERVMPPRRIANALAAYWGVIVLGGLMAFVLPGVGFTSPVELLLPGALTSQDFVAQLLEVRFSQIHDFLGFDVSRPAAPFVYTNVWGSNLAAVTAMLAAWASLGGSGRRRLAVAGFAVAIVPIVQSLNRGLWLSLAIGVVYVAVRQAMRRDVRALLLIVAAAATLVVAVLATPLGDLVTARAEDGHSDERRLTLYSASIEATLDRPLMGNGGPVDVPTLPADAPPAGTHGQLWLLLVSHGIPATIAFFAFFGVVIWRTRHAPTGSFAFWTNTMLVITVSQVAVYALIPNQLPVVMLATGIALREEDARRRAEAEARRATATAPLLARADVRGMARDRHLPAPTDRRASS